MPDLLHSYTRAFNSGCGYGSKEMTVNATVYAAPQALRPDERSSVWKKRAEKDCEADRRGEVVLQSSPRPPVSYNGRSERFRKGHCRSMYKTHHRNNGAECSVEHNRALRQYRADAYHELRQAVTNHAGNKADTKELGPSVGYNCRSLCWLVLANLH